MTAREFIFCRAAVFASGDFASRLRRRVPTLSKAQSGTLEEVPFGGWRPLFQKKQTGAGLSPRQVHLARLRPALRSRQESPFPASHFVTRPRPHMDRQPSSHSTPQRIRPNTEPSPSPSFGTFHLNCRIKPERSRSRQWKRSKKKVNPVVNPLRNSSSARPLWGPLRNAQWDDSLPVGHPPARFDHEGGGRRISGMSRAGPRTQIQTSADACELSAAA